MLAPIVLPSVHYLNICRNNTFDEAEPYGIKNEVLRSRIVQAMNSGESSEAGLPGNPWHSLFQLQRLSRNVRKNLSNITAPCLLLHAYDDDIAHRRNSELIYAKVKGPKTLIWLYNSYHMITIDNDRKQVIEESIRFIEQYQHPKKQSEHPSTHHERKTSPEKIGELL